MVTGYQFSGCPTTGGGGLFFGGGGVLFLGDSRVDACSPVAHLDSNVSALADMVWLATVLQEASLHLVPIAAARSALRCSALGPSGLAAAGAEAGAGQLCFEAFRCARSGQTAGREGGSE